MSLKIAPRAHGQLPTLAIWQVGGERILIHLRERLTPPPNTCGGPHSKTQKLGPAIIFAENLRAAADVIPQGSTLWLAKPTRLAGRTSAGAALYHDHDGSIHYLDGSIR